MANILILDDVGAMRRMLAHALSDDGHTITDWDSGEITHYPEAIVEMDVMITDLYMPKSDGIEAIRMAKKAKPSLKIIAMSGGAPTLETDYLPASLQLGASAFIRKPFEPEEMVACVRSLLAA